MTKDPRRFYVYAFLRSKDSKTGPKYSPYYIGKGNGNRAYTRARRNVLAPLDKGCIVFIQEGLTEREALGLEMYCIKTHGRVDNGTGILRNLTDGGEGVCGFRFSSETRRRFSEFRKGKKLSNETKNKISAANKGKTLGRKVSEETLRNMSLAMSGSNNPRWNQPVSTETRQKMANAKKGSKQTPKAIQTNITARAKYLYEIIDPDGEIYMTNDLKNFAKQYNLTVQLLAKTITGAQKHHKGWRARIAEKLK